METKKIISVFSIALAMTSGVIFAEEDENKDETITITGSQIKGAAVEDALAISVISSDDIEMMGIDSGDELMDLIPENGNNFLSEAENISGGVNSARGDVGAFNLRSLGTGNTLVLLNGRRLVNSASYQTESVGGSYVPVNSVSSTSIPVTGLRRLEVLRDGASAIYGADAVAGVVNHVMKDNFDGFNVKAKFTDFESLARNDKSLVVEWGNTFNDNRSNFSVFVNYLDRGRVNSSEDPRWADADIRWRLPEGSPWYGTPEGFTSPPFRNNSSNSLYGQFDIVSSVPSSHSLRQEGFVDNYGEFEVYPSGDSRCDGGFDLGDGTCAHVDGQGTYRYNLNENRDLVSDLERFNVFSSFVHDFGNGIESFNELSLYKSKSNMFRHPSYSFSSVKLIVAADNYWNPLGPIGSPNRLVGDFMADVPDEGMAITIDNYRYAEVPRIVDNTGETYRFLTGLRGSFDDWDWESAIVISKSSKDDVTHNRVSNLLMQAALDDTTSSAYNPFSGGVNSNIEQALIDVTRLSEAKLSTFDVKLSNYDIFELPAGPVGFMVGYEYRKESFIDDRDDRLDGTIVFTDSQGDTYPYVSDVVNSSPTPDGSGSRDVSSLFTEFQIPLLDTLDVQLALRYEDFSDVESATVGKVAFGWRPVDFILVRGSWSEAFRAPNLITINEEIVARNNTRTDCHTS